MAELAQEQGELTISMIDAEKAAEAMNYQKNESEMLSLAESIDPTITSIEDLNKAIAENPESP